MHRGHLYAGSFFLVVALIVPQGIVAAKKSGYDFSRLWVLI